MIVVALVVVLLLLALLWRRRSRQRSLSGTSAAAPVFSVEAIPGRLSRKSKERL